MKQADEAIDKVLIGLRASEAPAGMESRILQAIATAESREKQAWWMVFRALPPLLRRNRAAGVVSWQAGTSFPRLRICGALLAGLLVLVALFVPHHVHKAAQEPVAAKRVEALPTANAERAVPVVLARIPQKQTKPSLVRGETTKAGHEEPTDSNAAEDALAREEMLAPSHPAPPLPMTAQEKLFRQAVIGEHFDQLAMLNPEEREKADAKEDGEFKSFFGTETSAKQEELAEHGAAEDKSVEQKQGETLPMAAIGASQANSGRK